MQSEKIDEYYNTKYPIQRKKHTFIWGNSADVRASFYDSDKFKLLDIVSKSTPDYLPGDKSNKENKYVLYEEFVLGHTDLFKKTQGDNELTFTWYADTSDWAIIPAVKYNDTELTLNGKKLNDKDYSLSGIGTPTVMQKAGKNTLTITYHISTWFKALIVVNILSWLATLAYLIKKKTMK